MCGRSSSSRSAASIRAITGADRMVGDDTYFPRYNAGPGARLPILRRDKRDDDADTNQSTDAANTDENTTTENNSGELLLHFMKWGLVPSYSKSLQDSKSYNMINARAETVMTKNAFRRLVNKRRCVVPLDGFYEWHKFDDKLGNKKKQAYFIHMSDDAPGKPTTDAALNKSAPDNYDLPRVMYAAGVWDRWRDPETKEDLFSFSILTTEATQEFGWIHDRMPVVLQESQINDWLDESKTIQDVAMYLLPYKNHLTWYKVTDSVNKIKNQKLECLEPMDVVMKRRRANGIGRFFGAGPKKTKKPAVKKDKKPVTATTTTTTTKTVPMIDDEKDAKMASTDDKTNSASTSVVPNKEKQASKSKQAKESQQSVSPLSPPAAAAAAIAAVPTEDNVAPMCEDQDGGINANDSNDSNVAEKEEEGKAKPPARRSTAKSRAAAAAGKKKTASSKRTAKETPKKAGNSKRKRKTPASGADKSPKKGKKKKTIASFFQKKS